ncbi:PGF-CTERM sorting domain-containing protein [Halosolutus amylolyticus]|uniref:PGF-CTERM sorting domain-containing protein n=1 Tax=Halosolutus amylolyticus TaxID=2932267 RepID=A0ABD5PMY9_9EURY|nr:PGF-CTERM sorting domain-containing protein [Halosolutus amylolyticus]
MVGSQLSGSIDGRALAAFGAVLLGAVVVMGVVSGTATVGAETTATMQENVTEEEYVEPAPEEGDEYFEAVANDDTWISYVNPRDEYRDPYLGDGSGKICVTLLNEAGDPIAGETVPNTTVTIPTGEELEWHPHADPITVEYPVTDGYEQPLDADQFGTSDLPQGDGYMDSHCIEMHGQPEDATIEYGEAQIDGEYADDIEVVGYIQQQPAGDGWDTDIDPIEAAESYEEAGGEWAYQSEDTHGQVVVVLQLDRDPAEFDQGNGGDDSDGENDENGSTDDADQNETDDADVETDGSDDDGSDGLPGFGAVVAIVALAVAGLLATRR